MFGFVAGRRLMKHNRTYVDNKFNLILNKIEDLKSDKNSKVKEIDNVRQTPLLVHWRGGGTFSKP